MNKIGRHFTDLLAEILLVAVKSSSLFYPRFCQRDGSSSAVSTNGTYTVSYKQA